jgi:hypothetical protein
MAESCGWLFIDNVPLLYDSKKVARQLQVETWLDLTQLVGELKAEDMATNIQNIQSVAGYIV